MDVIGAKHLKVSRSLGTGDKAFQNSLGHNICKA